MVLFVHPDDESFGVGGTLWLLKDKFKLHLLCLTRGERGLVHKGGEADTAVGVRREGELRAVAQLLSADLTFLERIDGEVYADREICDRVRDLVQEVRPVAFFGMWPLDTHPDHTACSEIARKALFHSRYQGEFYLFEEAMCQSSRFHPDIYVDITCVIEQKKTMIRCHECQNAEDHLVQRAVDQSRFRGGEAKCDYAEGFKTIRPLTGGNSSLLLNLGAAPWNHVVY